MLCCSWSLLYSAILSSRADSLRSRDILHDGNFLQNKSYSFFSFFFFSFLTSASSCLSSVLPSSFVVCLSSYIRRRQFLSEALVCCYFLVFRRIGENISLDIFYFVNLTRSCSLIPETNKKQQQQNNKNKNKQQQQKTKTKQKEQQKSIKNNTVQHKEQNYHATLPTWQVRKEEARSVSIKKRRIQGH